MGNSMEMIDISPDYRTVIRYVLRGIQQLARKETWVCRLTDTENNILEALGDETLTGAQLLGKAGYDNSSHYRMTLSNLVKRGILGRNPGGYFKNQ